MRRILMALGLALLLPVAAFASVTIDDLLSFERQATVKLSVAGGHGSGVIISDDTILTAKHVAVEGADLNVTLSDGNVVTGHVSWMSPTADLATVVFNKPAGVRVASVSCAPLKAGQPVTVFGWPLHLPLSVAYGHILSAEPYNTGEGDALIVTDALIAPGDSGGPVYDTQGRVIGISDKANQAYSIGLFVPLNIAAPELCK